MGNNNYPMPPGRHPIPPVRFPGQQPLPHQMGNFPNRAMPGAPPFVHQPNQFQNMHQQHHQQFQPLPTGAAFHAMVHAQNNVYPIHTTNASSNSGSAPSSATVTSPTQPPTRKLPPVPDQQDSGDRHGDAPSSHHDRGMMDNIDRSVLSGFQEMRDQIKELGGDDEEETTLAKSYKKGIDVAIAATTGTTLLQQGAAMASKALDGNFIANIEKNPALNHLIQLADKLVDIGKTVPFIAPAFVILKIIIDIEQKARDADAKCNDLLDRINFMVSNITVLEKIKVIDPLKVIIEKMNNTLKQAASLIQTYRKQGAIARRLHMSNSQNFGQMAQKISACSQDLMLSLQIQQTGDISVLTRAIPVDPQDEEARSFVAAHGGQTAVNNNPELVEEFAKKMHLAMSDQVMDQMQSSMEDILEENQSRIETLLKENSSNTVADTIKALATEVREREAEQRLTCVQCEKEYRESANGSEACSFHKSSEISGTYSCCGKKAPCTFSSHRSSHHCEYPYTAFYGYAFAIIGYTDTTEEWASVSDKDMLTDHVEKASINRLIRWRSRHEAITKPMMVIHIGRINFDSPYYFHAFDANDLQAANIKTRSSGKTLIFRTNDSKSEYSMAEWTLNEAGDINGVKLSVKVATSDTATTRFAPIDIATVSLAGEIQTISKSTFRTYQPAEPYKLPEDRRAGHVLRSTALRERREFKAKSTLPLVVIPQGKMQANAQGAYVRNNADKFQGTIRVFNKSPPASQNYVTLSSCVAEYRLVGDKEYKAVDSLELSDTRFPVSIGPTQSSDIKFEAIVPRNEAQAALRQNCWNWAMVALHHPVRIRLTFKDIEGEECVFVQEYVHEPVGRLAAKEEKDILFLHIDDVLDGGRSVVRVTSEAKDSGYVVNVNGTRLSTEDLNKIVYKAEQNGKTEVKVGAGKDSDSVKSDTWALVDLSCRKVYGFKALMTQGTSHKTKTMAALGYALCPAYGDETAETRAVQYAVEEVEFPELEPEESLNVVVDDDVDDEKPVVTIKSAEPVIAIATGASSSVSAAIAEVSKATSSLDSAVFSSSIATLEKRLESLDTNVARMATALEKLVDILSH
ncbi:hypothetical protein BGZ99_010043 [Dissophora globulifera]|uniref:Mixed lineage kinase domain-containing protein n=1 Tax=Dissophora globulifera TaxID=979702 RepID=A0A9P6V0J3_9FUNG|nr:hypothetical protein BGZ99_010043 [Dissophora globulifera]